MSETDPAFKFDQLLSLFLEEQLSVVEHAELLELIQKHPELSQKLEEQLEQDQYLDLWKESQQYPGEFSDKVANAIDLQNDEFADRVVQYTHYNSIKKPNRIYQIALLATAASLCCAILYIFLNREVEEPLDANVALVTHIDGEANVALVQGDSLPPGKLELKKGLMDLTFYHGARLSVVAPAKLEIIDHMSVRCFYGKVKANVPAVARGFTVFTPDSKVIDLGTEFGLEVNESGESNVHVFDGEVEAYSSKKDADEKQLILAGQSLKPSTGELAEANLSLFNEFKDLSITRMKKDLQRASRWESLQERHRTDPRLIVHYDFEKDGNGPMVVKNKSTRGHELDAAMVGTMWSTGPWLGKSALEFVKPSDRLRINIPGEHMELTLACWVRVDSLYSSHTALMLSDGYEAGDLHWQINQSKTIQLGLKQENGVERFFAENSFTKRLLGQWIHLAVTIDLNKKVVRHYKNGRITLERASVTDQPISIGYACIGNYDKGHTKIGNKNFVRQLNGGMAEFMVFNKSLDEYEIRELALQSTMLHN